MRFLVDAHLPKRLAHLLSAAGHDVVHTLDLPLGNRTTDAVINQLSVTEQRILVTKDADFVDSHLITGKPYKLLLLSTGNISNNDLLRLFDQSLERVVQAFREHSYVELGWRRLIVHQ